MAKEAIVKSDGQTDNLAPAIKSFDTQRLHIEKIKSAKQLRDLRKASGYSKDDNAEYYAYLTERGYFEFDSSFGDFVAFKGDEAIGHFSVSFYNSEGTAEICRYLLDKHCGHGYGVEITKGVIDNIIKPSIGKVVLYISAPNMHCYTTPPVEVALNISTTSLKYLFNLVQICNYPSFSSCSKAGMVPHYVLGNLVVSTYPAVEAAHDGDTVIDAVRAISKFFAKETFASNIEITVEEVATSIAKLISCNEPITALAMIPRLESHFTYHSCPELRAKLVKMIDSNNDHLQHMLKLATEAIVIAQEEYKSSYQWAFHQLQFSLSHLKDLLDPRSAVEVAEYDSEKVAAREAMEKQYEAEQKSKAGGDSAEEGDLVVSESLAVGDDAAGLVGCGSGGAVGDDATNNTTTLLPEVMACIGGLSGENHEDHALATPESSADMVLGGHVDASIEHA